MKLAERFEQTRARASERLDLDIEPRRLITPEQRDQRLGIERLGTGAPQSKIIKLIGSDRVVPLQAVHAGGRVAWANFELARKLGFNVPAGNHMTPAFHDELISRLSYKIAPDQQHGDITVFADRYGGSGIGTNGGAGRAAFLPESNLNIKGIGLTPLAVVDPEDYIHSHGGAPMREGFLEAIWGEVDQNLFTHGSTQILAVIDTGDSTPWADGTKERRALIVRAGRQMRPAHLVPAFGDRKGFTHDMFVRAAKDSGDLVKRGQVPDIAATMRNLIMRHAQTAAEQVRWRLMHGAMSTSNMELDGSQLDLATHTTQPRTAPITVLGWEGFYGKEHHERGDELASVYKVLRDSMEAGARKTERAERIDVGHELTVAYQHQLTQQLMKATGLDPKTAAAAAKTKEAIILGKIVSELMALRNPGAINADKRVVDDVATVDVFNLLRFYPRDYFANPTADHSAHIRELLQPLMKGSPLHQTRTTQKIDQLIVRFQKAYAALMPLAGQGEAFARTVTQRAAFENAPIDLLYRSQLNKLLEGAIDEYVRTGDAHVFKAACDKIITASLRSIDGLLAQGERTRIGYGGMAVEKRAANGIDYAVHVFPSGDRKLHLEMPVAGNDEQGYSLHTLAGAPHLFRDQVEATRYRFSTDGWKTWQEAPARLDWRDGNAFMTIDIPIAPGEAGQLEGLLHCTARGDFWLKDEGDNFGGYAFAIPDDAALADILAP